MNRLKNILLLVFLATGIVGFAQEDVGIGKWRTHMPYQNVIDVELLGSKVYAATPYELFTYDEEDNSVQILNKINGLSDIGISTIARNEKLDVLMVAYTNANIDLIDNQGNIFNMSDIKDKNILANKTINNVVFKDELAYCACGFGIVVFDLNRKEVKDTYYIGPNGGAVEVTDIAFYNGRIYASTTEGLYYASEDGTNLANYASWSFDSSLIHPRLDYQEMEVFGGKLIINYASGVFDADTAFVFDGNVWDYFDKEVTANKREFRVCGNELFVSSYYVVLVYDENLNRVSTLYDGKGSMFYPNSALKESDQSYWLGDQRRGLIHLVNNWNYEDNIGPNGPSSTKVFELTSMGRHVWIATGGHATNWSKLYSWDGACHFDGDWWTNMNWRTVPQWATESITDLVCCAVDPLDTTVLYVGTWGHGMLKLKDDQYVDRYDAGFTPSSLEPWIMDPGKTLVSGLAFDSKGVLWAANSGANNLLSAMDRDGNWRSFYLGGSISGIDIANMIIDKNDYKWIIRRLGSDDKIIVFNDNGTLDDKTDDQVAILRCISGQGGISGTTVNALALDRDGKVWVGTDSGPCYFSDTKKIFESDNYDAEVVLVPRNDGTDQADPLFNEIKVLSIAVDGNNNKWFGLESGVYEMTPDCRTELLHFNTDNSPMLDNSVTSMIINDDGEVFFGTNQGVISYRGTATPGGNTNTDVTVYPNPVRPGFQGYVGIKGLVEDALVRITTVDGSFVTELIAEGGQAVWDCTTVNGQKVQPGIYLVFVSTRKGEEKYATKILVMN